MTPFTESEMAQIEIAVVNYRDHLRKAVARYRRKKMPGMLKMAERDLVTINAAASKLNSIPVVTKDAQQGE